MKTSSQIHLNRNHPSLNAIQIALLVIIWLLCTEQSALAYTDPGSGTLILQMLSAGVVSGLFYIRRFTKWIRNTSWSKRKVKK
jgi:hypothetical protein